MRNMDNAGAGTFTRFFAPLRMTEGAGISRFFAALRMTGEGTLRMTGEAGECLDLQLFADGGAAGGDGAGASAGAADAATGDTAPAAGEQSRDDRLRALGVPEAKLRKRAKPVNAVAESSAPTTQMTDGQAAAASTEGTQQTHSSAQTATPPKPTLKELLKDNPELNDQMQAVIRQRLADSKAAQETLSTLTPALELLAKKHGLDPANPDYGKLAQAIQDDKSLYAAKAAELGVSEDVAKRLDQYELMQAREQARKTSELEQQKLRTHFENLSAQGEELKKMYPAFDLATELRNPVFARMTSPSGGLDVATAFKTVHHEELVKAASEAAAAAAAQRLAASVQAGQRRPQENGASTQAQTPVGINWRTASKDQRQSMRERIISAKARGEKIYPGM